MKTIYQWYYCYSCNGNSVSKVFAYSDNYSKRPLYAPAHLRGYIGYIQYNHYLASNNELAFLARHNGIYFTTNLTNSARMEKKNIERKAISKFLHSHYGGGRKKKF